MQRVSDYFHVFLGGEERPGLFAYALGRDACEALSEWRPSGGPWDSISVDSWPYEGATIAMMQLGLGQRAIADGADKWAAVFSRTMEPAIGLGAELCWLGGEDSSWNPEVLRPGNSFGNVVAALQCEIGLVCEIDDTRIVRFLSDESLAPLWDVAASLLNPGDDLATETSSDS